MCIVHRKPGCFSLCRMFFYTWKYDRLFPSVKNILNKVNILYVRHVVCGPHDNTNVTHMAPGGPSV
jgi:hypothetical protein